MTARGTIPLKKEVVAIIASLVGPGPYACHCDRNSGDIVLEGESTDTTETVKMQRHGVGTITYLEVPLKVVRSVLQLTHDNNKSIEPQQVELRCNMSRKEVLIRL
jgi:hypothetical protein